ncbi:MAG: NAD-dependent epimerase/dehydratase family protein [bacterium]|nr:NAD-dependent epimerase/dehydratase family protein [bacterium]
MRVLVTGGAGFIGGHVCERLAAEGHTPIILDNLSTGSHANIPAGAVFLQGDVRSPQAVETAFAGGIDAVMHIAGQASIRLSYLDPSADLNVNTLGTINVLSACIAHRVPRLIFASSMTVYGNGAPTPAPETTPVNPVSYYAITKYAAERYVHTTASRPDLETPLHVTSFRMFNVYGERQSLNNAYQGVFAIFTGNVLRGEPITIHSDGEQSRDFVHVRDIARAWVSALDNPAAYGQVINLGTGVEQPVNRLCDLTLTYFGRSRADYPVRHQPAQPGDMRRSAADISRARELLGWEPTIRFETGMAQFIDWAKTVIPAKT